MAGNHLREDRPLARNRERIMVCTEFKETRGINETRPRNDYETRGTEERDRFGQIAFRFMVTATRGRSRCGTGGYDL